MPWFIVPEISAFLSSNKDFSALNKRTCESFFKITPENDKINFVPELIAILSPFRSFFSKYTLIHYLLFRKLKGKEKTKFSASMLF